LAEWLIRTNGIGGGCAPRAAGDLALARAKALVGDCDYFGRRVHEAVFYATGDHAE
jgi:hypothetical protein